LWIEMICYMHQGTPYGYMKVNHMVIHSANLARMIGATLSETEGWLSELKNAGVYSVDDDGAIFSKRMIRDEEVRKARADGGKMGGNPNLKPENKVNLNANLKPTPSSSSSSSSSKLNTVAIAPPNGVSPSVWQDFQKLRKAKKAALTDTAMRGIEREAEKAGWTMNAALQECCTRGWTGFKAEWVAGKPSQDGGIIPGAI